MATVPQSSLVSIPKFKSFPSSLTTHNSHLPLISPLSISTPKLTIQISRIKKKSPDWKICAAASSEEVLPSVDIVTATDDGTANIISLLLFIAFIVLSVLTIGVIYLGVTDFLTKRQKDKYEKEESAKKKKMKKSGKKGQLKARAGPKGFGQKIDDYDDDDFDN